jgi:hypothetical protein
MALLLAETRTAMGKRKQAFKDIREDVGARLRLTHASAKTKDLTAVTLPPACG